MREDQPLRETLGRGKGSREKMKEGPPLAVSFLLEGSRDPKTAEPVDKLEEVPVRKDCPDCCIKISTELKDPLKSQILVLLRQYIDVFAWTAKDMPGVDSKVMMHKLGIRSGF